MDFKIKERLLSRKLIKFKQEFPDLPEDQLLTLLKLRRKNRAGIAAMFRDLNDKSMIDGLTELHNLRCFSLSLDREIAVQERETDKSLSIIVIDIDHFKIINDNFGGHLAGDKFLKDIAALLKCAVRNTDIVARTGGDELAIILPNTDLEDAQAIAEKLRKKIENMEVNFKDPKTGENKILTATASLGVAQRLPKETAEQLRKRADDKLYEAKDAGRNKVVVCDGKTGSGEVTTA
ncbi:MAG: GGDEF domain-containing protein [Patescibacteria group bacterium]